MLLNVGVAIGMSEGPARGLALIERTRDPRELDRYHLFHAARADMGAGSALSRLRRRRIDARLR